MGMLASQSIGLVGIRLGIMFHSVSETGWAFSLQVSFEQDNSVGRDMLLLAS